jgi:Zn-dependent peptidase ImmA (M78 family)
LANRNLSVETVSSAVVTDVSLLDLVNRDLEVEFRDIQSLATFFRRPWSYILVDEPEQFPDVGRDNRTWQNRRQGWSIELLDDLEAADSILESAAELFPGSGYQVPILSADQSVEPFAHELRAFLGVTEAQQVSARDEFAALRLWVTAIHARGIFVAQRRLRDAHVRAFSKIRLGQAVVVVDSGDGAYSRIFSALHEYCHIILRTTGVCDLDDHSSTERFCNAVAAATLLPDTLLAGVLGDRSFTGNEEDDLLVRSLSHELRVSQAVALIRLRDRGTVSHEIFQRLEERRAARRGQSATSGGQFYPPRINRVGRKFARSVVDAVGGGLIDRQDASGLLEIGEHLFDRYAEELSKSDSETV